MESVLKRLRPAPRQDSLEDCLLVLLRGIKEHSRIAGESAERDFHTELDGLEETFKGKENARTVAEAAVGILAEYTDHVTRTIARQRLGLSKATADVAAAAKELALDPGDGFSSLEQQVSAISSDADLAAIKGKLASDIAALREKGAAERRKISALMEAAAAQLTALRESASGQSIESPAVRDLLTGLPVRALAEGELLRAHQDPADSYLVIFVVKRLALINAKFGFARGDEVLLKVVSHLAQSLPDFHTFYRWAPCAFLAVAPPEMSFRELRSQVQVIELTRLTPTLEWEGHNAMVPVALDCRVLSVQDFSTAPELFLRLDTLASDV